MPESRFKELFYNSSPKLKCPADLCSVVTLGLLGPEYMAGALYGSSGASSAGRETSGGRLRKRTKRARKAKRKPKRRPRRLPVQYLYGNEPWTRRTREPRYTDLKLIDRIPSADRTLHEQNQLQLERNYMTKLYAGGPVNRMRRDWQLP